MSVVGQNMASIVDYFNIVGGLTNGVQMLTRIDGVTEIPFFNIKRAIEYSHATKQEFAIKSLKGNNTEEILVADVVFAFESISLPNREFIVRIRDNLSGILYQRASAMYRRVI